MVVRVRQRRGAAPRQRAAPLRVLETPTAGHFAPFSWPDDNDLRLTPTHHRARSVTDFSSRAGDHDMRKAKSTRRIGVTATQFGETKETKHQRCNT